LSLLIIRSSTKLEIRAKQFLPGSEGVGGEREGAGKREGGLEGRNKKINKIKCYVKKKKELQIRKM
jgi:hypothetical protein